MSNTYSQKGTGLTFDTDVAIEVLAGLDWSNYCNIYMDNIYVNDTATAGTLAIASQTTLCLNQDLVEGTALYIAYIADNSTDPVATTTDELIEAADLDLSNANVLYRNNTDTGFGGLAVQIIYEAELSLGL